MLTLGGSSFLEARGSSSESSSEPAVQDINIQQYTHAYNKVAIRLKKQKPKNVLQLIRKHWKTDFFGGQCDHLNTSKHNFGPLHIRDY